MGYTVTVVAVTRALKIRWSENKLYENRNGVARGGVEACILVWAELCFSGRPPTRTRITHRIAHSQAVSVRLSWWCCWKQRSLNDTLTQSGSHLPFRWSGRETRDIQKKNGGVFFRGMIAKYERFGETVHLFLLQNWHWQDLTASIWHLS